jgi:hypothetical protein
MKPRKFILAFYPQLYYYVGKRNGIMRKYNESCDNFKNMNLLKGILGIKKELFFRIVILVAAVAGLGLLHLLRPTSPPQSPPPLLPLSQASPDAVYYSVSSGQPGPKFRRIILDPAPLEIFKGDQKRFWVALEDQLAIGKVWAEIETNSKNEVVPMRLTEGTATNGIWYGELVLRDSRDSRYQTKFFARDPQGTTSQIIMNWTNN